MHDVTFESCPLESQSLSLLDYFIQKTVLCGLSLSMPKNFGIQLKIKLISGQMTAGQPQRLLLPNWDLSAPVVVYNNKKFERPILVQLADAGDNPTTEAGIRVQLAKDPGIKVSHSH